MTPAQIVRNAIPGADDATCEHVLWGRTCFPMGRVTARDIYRAASRLVRANRSGIVLCDFCDRPSVDKWTCAECAKALEPARPSKDRE